MKNKETIVSWGITILICLLISIASYGQAPTSWLIGDSIFNKSGTNADARFGFDLKGYPSGIGYSQIALASDTNNLLWNIPNPINAGDTLFLQMTLNDSCVVYAVRNEIATAGGIGYSKFKFFTSGNCQGTTGVEENNTTLNNKPLAYYDVYGNKLRESLSQGITITRYADRVTKTFKK